MQVKDNAMNGLYSYLIYGTLTIISTIVAGGCHMGLMFGGISGDQSDPTGLAAKVADKAAEVADQIGGLNGFGGVLMDGYLSHMDAHMGFGGMANLADPNGHMMVRFSNQSDQDCTFYAVYLASYMGMDNRTMEVNVPAGDVVTVEMPSMEIIGLGSLTVVGAVAVHMADGRDILNTMAVPGLLGSDYQNGQIYHCFLTPDADDLDADGNSEELTVITQALQLHMRLDGMAGHTHMMTAL